MNALLDLIAPYRKWIAAAVSLAGALLSANLLPDSVANIIAAVIGALGALGVYAAPNRPLVPTGPGAANGADGMGQTPGALTGP